MHNNGDAYVGLTAFCAQNLPSSEPNRTVQRKDANHDIDGPGSDGLVPRAGVEPARGCPHRFLRPTRLPFRHLGAAVIAHFGEARQYHSPVRLNRSPVRLTVAALLCLVLAGCSQFGPPATPSAGTTSTPVPSFDPMASGPRFSQPPVSPPTPPTITLPGFACADSSGGKA